MIKDYDGDPVLGPDGNQIGAVERTYVDDNDVVRYVAVQLVSDRGAHLHLVPADGVQRIADGVQIPYTQAIVAGSPSIGGDEDTIEGNILGDVQAYFDRAPANAQSGNVAANPSDNQATAETLSSSQPTAEAIGRSAVSDDAITENAALDEPTERSLGTHLGEARVVGDVVEIPVLEERLVKQTVVKEIIRVRKRQATETQQVQADLRQERLDIDADPGVIVHDRQSP